MEAGIPGDDDWSYNMFPPGLQTEVIQHCTVEFSFLQDVVFVDDLVSSRSTPMILADFSIMMLLFILS